MFELFSIAAGITSLIITILFLQAFFRAARATVITACKLDHGHCSWPLVLRGHDGKESTLRCDCPCHSAASARLPNAATTASN